MTHLPPRILLFLAAGLATAACKPRYEVVDPQPVCRTRLSTAPVNPRRSRQGQLILIAMNDLTHVPIPGSRFTLIDAQGRSYHGPADSASAAASFTLPPGRYVVRSHHIGFHARLDTLELPDAGLTLELPLHQQPVDECFGVVVQRVPWWKFW